MLICVNSCGHERWRQKKQYEEQSFGRKNHGRENIWLEGLEDAHLSFERSGLLRIWLSHLQKREKRKSTCRIFPDSWTCIDFRWVLVGKGQKKKIRRQTQRVSAARAILNSRYRAILSSFFHYFDLVLLLISLNLLLIPLFGSIRVSQKIFSMKYQMVSDFKGI